MPLPGHDVGPGIPCSAAAIPDLPADRARTLGRDIREGHCSTEGQTLATVIKRWADGVFGAAHGRGDHLVSQGVVRHPCWDALMTWLMPVQLLPIAGVAALLLVPSLVRRPVAN